MHRLICLAVFLLATYPALAFDLTVVSYKVESDADTDPAKMVQERLRGCVNTKMSR